ncbi:MAG: hypothetical protein HQK77_20445 [Desulfobacterales bacterium]|nr:hypothetical protein [Desulfobacterales bacterium]
MRIYLEEKIGNPDLFTGRKRELKELLQWTTKIKQKLSPSRALMSRRKTGKTALLQRFYNLVFEANDGVIPFYYEVREENQWAIEFCEDFFTKFILHYIAFKSRKYEYLNIKLPFDNLIKIAKDESQVHLIDMICNVKALIKDESISLLWHAVRDAPRSIAEMNDDRVLQMVDEFQYLNRKIFRDRQCQNRISDFAQPYMSTAEYKNAPLLISGSWVGLLMYDVIKMPGRFRITFLENIPEDEALEMILNYSIQEDIPVSEETAQFIASLSEGNPFYISEIMRSSTPNKDLTTQEGVLKTLEFETLNKRGSIRGTWMEYIQYAFSTVNEIHAKNIVLYLCKNKHREVSRKELREALKLTMPENELEKKLDALVQADIIEEGRSHFYFQGVQDNIFDKVFRGRYADEITTFDPKEIANEYKALFEQYKTKYKQLDGQFSHYKGMFAEFMIIKQLMYQAYKYNDIYLSWMHNLPADFKFTEYKSVWSYKSAPIHQRDIQIDVFARAKAGEYSLIGEVKNRQENKFSLDEAMRFKEKAEILMQLEKVEKAVLFVFCKCGFSEEVLKYVEAQGIAWTDESKWITDIYRFSDK